jgi:nicotinic acid mononucleotide adenylyltransferase
MWFQDVNNLDEAGWFQEAHACPDKFGNLWAMTPTHKLLAAEGPRDIILLSTGGFAPIHNGHILMMEVAKSYMESQGFRVRGGYVSPGHDDYVVTYKGVDIYAPERLAIANNILKDNPWIMVDPWESIGCSCSINYTSVIDHLERLFNCQVCYVVGSDNARFSLAFKNHGMLCIVQRSVDVLPNPKYRERSYMLSSERVFIADNEPISGSSTAVRNEEEKSIGT